MDSITLSFREIYVLMTMWSAHLIHGDSSTGESGIGSVDYSGLIRHGLVEHVNLNTGQESRDKLVQALAKDAIQQIQSKNFPEALDALVRIVELPGNQWVHRLTDKGIAYLQSQTDAVPDQVFW